MGEKLSRLSGEDKLGTSGESGHRRGEGCTDRAYCVFTSQVFYEGCVSFGDIEALRVET